MPDWRKWLLWGLPKITTFDLKYYIDMEQQELIEQIIRLKKDKKAIILAHYYTRGEVQQVADFVGDSLALAVEAQKTDAEIILFAGVRFMGETAKVLCPSRKVLLPVPEADCSLAQSCSAEQLREFKAQYPNVYHLIEQWKEPLKNEILKGILLDKKRAVELGDMTLMQNQETALPNFMMLMESEIFREVLKSLFRKRIKAVHIHDAIVLPQTRAVVDVNKIEEVMRSAYKHFGLHPTFSIDKYE